MFDVCTAGDTAHIDTIFKLLPHTCQRVWQQLEYRIYVCRVTRGSHIISSYQKKKNFFQFSCGCDRHMFSVPGSTAKQRQKMFTLLFNDVLLLKKMYNTYKLQQKICRLYDDWDSISCKRRDISLCHHSPS